MEFIDPKLLSYCESHSETETSVLKDLNRQTHLKISDPRMLSGHLQGRFLAFLSKLIQPKHILEIGTYTGYSAICLAEGLAEGGKLITIDPYEETNQFARSYIEKAGLNNKIQLIEGEAQSVIPSLKENFDLVFIDADKQNYNLYFDLVIDKVTRGGLIIADNVLWSGKVITEPMDAATLSIHRFNQKVNTDPRVECVLLPVRDGLMLMRKL
jgi:predicted O-methyltransferase YrrM